MIAFNEKDRVFALRDAAYEQMIRKQITPEFFDEVEQAIQALHGSGEEQTMADLPQDILDYLNTIEIGDAR